MDLEMHLGVGMTELGQELQGSGPGVQRDLGGIGLDDKDVVDVRLGRLQDQRDGGITREFLDGAGWDAS